MTHSFQKTPAEDRQCPELSAGEREHMFFSAATMYVMALALYITSNPIALLEGRGHIFFVTNATALFPNYRTVTNV
jgi:hypothetical protein